MPTCPARDVNETDLEIVCGDLIDQWLARRKFKRAIGTVCYFKEGAIFRLPKKFKPSRDLLAQVKAKASWAKGAVFLHDLPENEAFLLFQKYS